MKFQILILKLWKIQKLQQRKKVNRPKKSLADKDYKRPETNKKYKEGSIASYANMLARDNNDNK